MRRAVSPGTGQPYPLTMICAVFRVPRSTVYPAMMAAPVAPVIQAKRGPKTPVSDSEIVTAIRAVLAATPFHGEGYRKIRARLAHRGFAIGGKRVLRLLRQHQLLAPRRLGPPKWGSRARRYDHDGAAGRDVGHRRDALLHRGGRLVLVLRRHRSLRRRARGLTHHEDRRSLGRARAAAPGRAPGVRPFREGRRPRTPDSLRLGPTVHCRCVDQRGEVARDDHHAVVRRRAGVQWRHRALHANAEGAVPLSPSLPESRRGAADHRRVHHALQHRVAHRAARPSDASGRADRGSGGMTDETRSLSGVRIDDRGRGRYVDIPLACPRNRERYSTCERPSSRNCVTSVTSRGATSSSNTDLPRGSPSSSPPSRPNWLRPKLMLSWPQARSPPRPPSKRPGPSPSSLLLSR